MKKLSIKKIPSTRITVLVAVVILFVLSAFAVYARPGTLLSIPQSHLDANIPPMNKFDQILQRDLKEYFGSKYQKDVLVNYELLRKGPTQSGVAYPKYYLWVTLSHEGAEIAQGAVRVAAIQEESFDVTHFLTSAEMRENAEQIFQIFPKEVGDKIVKRLEN